MRVDLTRKQFEDFRQTLESAYLQGITLPRFSTEQRASTRGAIHTVSFERNPQNEAKARKMLSYSGINVK